MKRILILIIFLFLAFHVNGQHLIGNNLVPEFGFEIYDTCPTYWDQICNAIPWNGAGYFASQYLSNGSEYLNVCSNNILLPNLNPMIYNPHSGNGCSGLIPYIYSTGGTNNFNNYREYIEVKLIKKMIANKKYCCDYYSVFSNSISTISISNIDLFISNNFINTYDSLLSQSFILIDTIPQIKNKKGIISDTVNWTKISGVYEAKGNEQYITIGNFNDDNHTNWIPLKPNYGIAYYLIDDVSVCECSFDINLGQDTSLCEGEGIILNPNLPNATYTWQDSSHATTYEVKQPGTYWVRAYVAEYDITSTDTIVISAKDDNICNPPLTIPNVITPNGDSQNDNFVIQNAETYDIALQIYNRWGNLIYETTNYQNDFSCRDCADGVYFYVLKAKSKRNGREKDYKGKSYSY